jgi:hypothetical protein
MRRAAAVASRCWKIQSAEAPGEYRIKNWQGEKRKREFVLLKLGSFSRSFSLLYEGKLHHGAGMPGRHARHARDALWRSTSPLSRETWA